MSDATPHELLTRQGLTAEDLAWFDSIDWDESAVPAVDASQLAAYRRREAALNRAIAPLTFAERGQSREGRLAAALGARLADWRDPDEEEG